MHFVLHRHRLPRHRRFLGLATAAVVATMAFVPVAASAQTLLNVSYDPTRELYREINALFTQDWKAKTGKDITLRTSHGGSGSQARTVIDGIEADVVTLGIASDIDAIAEKTGKIPADWRTRLPNNSLPYTSTVVFVVRKGNPKNIRTWGDLIKPGIGVITPNPKTSAGGRWNFLATWGYALEEGGNAEKAREAVTALYKNVPVLDSGARGSTITFAQRELGDVLPAWENEAHLILQEFGADKFDIVVPPFSISAEPPVALVEGNVDKKGTREAAKAYLDFLYTPAAQTVIARNHYRPSRPETVEKGTAPAFDELKLFRAEDMFGDWSAIQKTYFDAGGVFDEISKGLAR